MSISGMMEYGIPTMMNFIPTESQQDMYCKIADSARCKTKLSADEKEWNEWETLASQLIHLQPFAYLHLFIHPLVSHSQP